MTDYSCEVRDGRLVAAGDFSRDADTGFDRACQALLSSGEKALVADLVGVTHICSTYVGLLAELSLGAKEAGKSLTIRTGPRVAAVLREAGLNHAAVIEEMG